MSTATAAPAPSELNDRSAYAAPKDECDLIMKGGITSGVVYPWTACWLATRYQLRRLGGASAGAIAATLAAAAELGRRSTVDPEKPATEAPGFVGLYAVPTDLGRNLSQLFQPSPQLRAPYRLLTTWIEPGWGFFRRLGMSMALVVARAPWLVALVTVAALLPGFAVTATLLDGHTGAEWARLLRAQLVFLPGAMGLGLLAAFGWVMLPPARARVRALQRSCQVPGLQPSAAHRLADKPL
jgi:Patatin-like phospholipase